MNQRKIGLIGVTILVAAPFAYAAFIYPSLPATIPLHFNYKGEADGFGEKDSIFLLPTILGVASFFTYFLLTNLKSIDPKRYKPTDESIYNQFALFSVAFLSGLSCIIIYTSSNSNVPVMKLILPVLGFAFYGLGWYMPKFHQNYFAGFKLPWTLENENNWNATHAYAGKLWKIGGACIIVFAAALPPKVATISFILITAAIVVVPIAFSFRMFKNGNQLK